MLELIVIGIVICIISGKIQERADAGKGSVGEGIVGIILLILMFVVAFAIISML